MPHAFLHLLGSEALTPATVRGLGQIHEGTLGSLEVLDLVEDLAARTHSESRCRLAPARSSSAANSAAETFVPTDYVRNGGFILLLPGIVDGCARADRRERTNQRAYAPSMIVQCHCGTARFIARTLRYPCCVRSNREEPSACRIGEALWLKYLSATLTVSLYRPNVQRITLTPQWQNTSCTSMAVMTGRNSPPSSPASLKSAPRTNLETAYSRVRHNRSIHPRYVGHLAQRNYFSSFADALLCHFAVSCLLARALMKTPPTTLRA
jgi:hypothetical protein